LLFLPHFVQSVKLLACLLQNGFEKDKQINRSVKCFAAYLIAVPSFLHEEDVFPNIFMFLK